MLTKSTEKRAYRRQKLRIAAWGQPVARVEPGELSPPAPKCRQPPIIERKLASAAALGHKWRVSRRKTWGLLIAAACLLVPAHAAATEEQPETVDLGAEPASAPAPEKAPDWEKAPSERRCGFALGLSLGPFVGTATGYPNDSLKIDREAYETDVGFAGGGAGGSWIGVAITDWFVFGLGGMGGRLFSADHTTTYGAFAFHIDAFPAYSAGGPWRDLGLMLDVGLGLTWSQKKDGEDKLIDSGGASRIAFGGFYEGIRLWKLSMGPFAAADVMFSPSAMRPAAWAGWRTAFYAGP